MSKQLTRAHWNMQSQEGRWAPKREAIEDTIDALSRGRTPFVFSFNEAGGRLRELQRLADRRDLHLFVPAGPGGGAVPILTSAKPRHAGYRVLLPRTPGVTSKDKGVSWVRMDGGWVEATTHMPAHPDTSKGAERVKIRAAYARQMNGLVGWYDNRRPAAPVRIVGDLNTIPSSPLVKPLRAAGLTQVVDDPTFHRRILDHGWVNDNVIVLDTRVIPMPGKDHRLVVIHGRRCAR